MTDGLSVGALLRRAVQQMRRLPPHSLPEQFETAQDLEPCDWAERFILIATTQRSGSHFLGHMLRETEEYGVPLEYLNPRNAKFWCRRFGTEDLNELFPHFVRLRTSANGTFCLKAHWGHFSPFREKIGELTRNKGFEKVVWLVRRNQLAQAISYVIASQTRSFVSGAPERRPAVYDYSAIVARAEKFRQVNLSWQQYLCSEYPERHYRIVYEDLVGDVGNRRADLQEFLGGAKMLRPSPRIMSQRTERNTQWSERFRAEVRDEHAWILTDAGW